MSNYNYQIFDEPHLPPSPSCPSPASSSVSRPPPPPPPPPQEADGSNYHNPESEAASNYGNYGQDSNFGSYGNIVQEADVSSYHNYGGRVSANFADYGQEEKSLPRPEAPPLSSPSLAPPPPNKTPPFRKWVEELSELRQIEDLPERRRKLVEWHEALVATAVHHAASIISSLHDPVKLASMAAAMGGVAGGTKFIFEGLVFKLATDPKMGSCYLYGAADTPNLERAAKAASQELKGANSLFECLLQQKVDITVPMQVLIDYCGERLVAMPLLPIKGSDTLVYGSCDGGRTVLTDSQIHQHLSDVCAQLHLAEHPVGSSTGPVKLWLAGDVEGHRGSDGKLYLLDLARTFPPEDPRLVTHLPPCASAVWFRLIRPEFLRILKRQGFPALSSDSFTQWGRPDMSHNIRARKATEYLFSHQIPSFAWHLGTFLNSAPLSRSGPLLQGFQTAGIEFPTTYASSLLQNPIKSEELFKSLSSYLNRHLGVPSWALSTTFYPPNYIESVDLSKEFHDHGIPMRHLGLVHEEVFAPELKAVLEREGIARSFKNLIRAELRKSGSKTAAQIELKPPLEVVLEWLNVILRGPAIVQQKFVVSESERTKVIEVWENILPADVISRYGSVLTYGLESLAKAMEAHRFWIINYLIKSIGINVTNSCKISKLVSDELCPKSHGLQQGVRGRQGVRCDLCKQSASGDEAASCLTCDFDCCSRCLGKSLALLTKADVIGFEPKTKNMSFINAIQAQCLSDQAVRLVAGSTESVVARREEFLKLMRQVSALCENLLRTDPNCIPIKEQLRCATLAAALLSENTADKRSVSDDFLRNFLAEVSASGGVISDGLRLITAAGAIGDPLLIAKATKNQNLLPLYSLVEAGGEVGFAVANALDNGNRLAVAYLLHVMKHKLSCPPPDPHVHFMRKKWSIAPAHTRCQLKHNFILRCSECSEHFCEHRHSKTSPLSPFLNTQLIRFHRVLDLGVHPHDLIITDSKFHQRISPCSICKASPQSYWTCLTCAVKSITFNCCSNCIEPNMYSIPNPVLAPNNTTSIDDAMLLSIVLGLQDNHAFSTLALVDCMETTYNGTCEFFKRSKFSSSLTSLNFSANPLNALGVRALRQALPTMHLRSLTLDGMKTGFERHVDILTQGLLEAQIETLSLCGHVGGFGDRFAAELKKNVKPTSLLPHSLKNLSLKSSELTSKGVADLLSLEWKFESFKVSLNKIGNASLIVLARYPGLRRLSAYQTELTSECYNELSDTIISNTSLVSAKFHLSSMHLNLFRGSSRSQVTPGQTTRCPADHELVRGANTMKYKGQQACCDVCRLTLKAKDAFSCALCGYDVCLTRCFDMVTFATKHLGIADMFAMNCDVGEYMNYLTISKFCQLQQYSYIVWSKNDIIPLVATLQLKAIDFRGREYRASPTAIIFACGMGDSLQRLSVSFAYLESSGQVDFLMSHLTGRVNLTDLKFCDPPVNESFFELIRRGNHLQRLSLRWRRAHQVTSEEFSLVLSALAHLQPTLQYLQLANIEITSSIQPYVGQQDHIYHCLTGPSVIKLKHMRLKDVACAALFQAVSYNASLTVFDFTLSDSWHSAQPELARTMALEFSRMIEKCDKLVTLEMRHVFVGDLPSNLVDSFIEFGLPLLQANRSIKQLRLKPPTKKFGQCLAAALAQRPGDIYLNLMDNTHSLNYDLVTELAPKISGLNLYSARLPSAQLSVMLQALLSSGSSECKERTCPLHVLELGRVSAERFNSEQIALCAQIFANPLLDVKEICLADFELNSEWFHALKGCSSLARLDLMATSSGNNSMIDFHALTELVVQARCLTSLNISNRRPQQGDMDAFLVAMIEGNPNLHELYAILDTDLTRDYIKVVVAAADPRSNLLHLMLKSSKAVSGDPGFDFEIQEILWRCPKPLLFMPLPSYDSRASLVHWARMDRLGAPVFAKPKKCHPMN